MTLFTHHIAVDWSAAASPIKGRDSIWICEAGLSPQNVSTRAEAMGWISDRIERALEKGDRLAIGFDFAFGLPGGIASAISGDGSWQSLWKWLDARLEDGPDNRNNRFEVAASMNAAIGLTEGPFWGHPHQHHYVGLSPKAPTTLPPSFPKRRLVEKRVPSASSVFQLAYTGAVGSQSLLGMKALAHLRHRFDDAVAVWPFDTHFDQDLSAPVTLIEIYPSAHAVNRAAHPILDAAQVVQVGGDMARWDRTGALPDKLSAFGLSPIERQVVLREEGWILGIA